MAAAQKRSVGYKSPKLVLKRGRGPTYVYKIGQMYMILPPELKDVPGAERINPCKAVKVKNPSPVERASKLSKKFHGAAPRTVKHIDFRSPKCLALIGSCAQLDYISDKWDGKRRQYYHKFEKPCLVMADPDPQPDGSRLIVILGKFKITERGIIG